MTIYDEKACEEKHRHMNAMITGELKHMRELLESIRDQTIRTNGRVTKLERWQITLMTAVVVLATVRWPELKTLIGMLN
jgi:hypothetical protein